MNCDVEQQVGNGIWALIIGLMVGAGGYLVLSEGFKTKKRDYREVKDAADRRKLQSGLGSLGG